jgi:hypothetical protein
MANTEGMPDEVMNELLSPGDVVDNPSPAVSLQPSGASSFLQRRMDMPMGGRPAAIVTRRSKQNQQKQASPAVSTVNEEKEAKNVVAEKPPIMSEIVERPFSSRNRVTAVPSSGAGSGAPKSLFAQQQRRKPQANGFPSIKKPIGTYAKRSKVKKGKPVAPPSMTALSDQKVPSDVDANGIHRDSEALMSQMSTEQIQESIQDLQLALSPEMLEFLRKRSQGKKKSSSNTESTKVDKPKKTPIQTIVSVDTVDEAKEKERLATVMSSIRTYNDMDQAYEQEVGGQDGSNLLSTKSEWDQACSLLRSTNPRQTLWAARIVCNDLERDLKEGKRFYIGGDKEDQWPYPSLLPVSLRCLLDASVSHTNELALHSYVLRSVYALLRLRSPTDHVVDVVGKDKTTDSIYQQDFLEDAVPTAPFGSLYPSISATPMAVDGATVAYATASSSTSAQQDGENFVKDPMWTLLSKMRIVPRVAQLLKSHYSLPEEGLVAVCGILSMLSVRSPGAASAIAQHKTLLPSLLKKTVMPPTDGEESHFLKTEVMLPVMIQLNTMARQSRVVAAKIPYLSFLPAILAVEVGKDEQRLLEVQKWALLLWRKLLRYGTGFVGVESLVSLSITCLGEKGPLAPEYCSLFSAWVDCVKVFEKSGGKLKSLSNSDKEILSSTISWLTPSVRLCAESLSIEDVGGDLSLQGSMMRLITSFIAARSMEGEESEGLAILLEDSSFLTKLSHLIESDRMANLVNAIPINVSSTALEGEVGVCCLINELTSLVGTLYSLENANAYPQIHLMSQTLKGLLQGRLSTPQHSTVESPSSTSPEGWRKQCHFAISKFLLSSTKPSEDQAVVRLFAMDLIGRLDLGDEAKAAILFSNDYVFAMKDASSSLLPDMFMRELCGSDSGRKQLDHSFKLQRGFGITADGLGPFATDSLLSDADRGSDSDVGLLPMGKTWLWQVLSGSLGSEATTSAGVEEVCTITASCLSLLSFLEDDYETSCNAFNAVTPGCKLYFLLNIFLYPESIISDQELRSKASALLTSLSSQLGPMFAKELLEACLDHSQLKTSKTSGEEKVDRKDEKLLAVLSGTPDMPSKEVRTTQEFSLELCNAYVEYGAQYSEFTMAIRFLLRPEFPAKIRCEVLKRLRDVSHLLALEEEQAQDVTFKRSLEELLLEGFAPNGERDASEVLDLLADILRLGQGGQDGFFFIFAVATLCRSLLGAIRSSSGLEAMKRRLLKLPRGTADVILAACSAGPTNRTDLVDAVISARAATEVGAGLSQVLDKPMLETWLSQA